MGFGHWPDEIHKEIDQLKRIANAKKINKKKVLEIDKEAQTASIVGSSGEIYTVTLDNCNCADFSHSGGKPCKHIYRLAMELDLLPVPPPLNPEKAKEFAETIPAEVERFTALYNSGAISSDKYIKIVTALTAKNE